MKSWKSTWIPSDYMIFSVNPSGLYLASTFLNWKWRRSFPWIIFPSTSYPEMILLDFFSLAVCWMISCCVYLESSWLGVLKIRILSLICVYTAAEESKFLTYWILLTLFWIRLFLLLRKDSTKLDLKTWICFLVANL